MKRFTFAMLLFFALISPAPAAPGDWPEPRHDPDLTAIQPAPGVMRTAPTLLADYDTGRTPPSLTPVDNRGSHLALVSGTLHCYDPTGRERWSSRPEGLTFTRIVACEDLDADGKKEIVLEAGRPAQPYGAVVSLSLADGRLLWKEDVEPMSYSWQAYVSAYLPVAPGKQVLVVMQGYPPDKDNGYCALYEFPKGQKPTRRWRYPFSAYTCFPAVFTTDVDGDGVKEIAIISHSRMWVLDAPTGQIKQFIGWDVSPANVRSYGLNQFVDLDGDGREDFVCLANFSKHYEVLLNRNNQFVQAWHQGYADSVTTAHVSVCWPAPAFADLDGDGKKELVVSVFDQDHWTTRAHDAVTGQVKYSFDGVIAAAMSDVDHDGRAEILAERASTPTRSRPDGGYDLDHSDGASLLKVTNGHLQKVWTHPTARPSRAEGPLTVASDTKQFLLTPSGTTYTLIEKPTPPAPPPAIPAPPIVGAVPQELFVADLLNEGSNQLLLYTKPTATLLRLTPDHTLQKLLDIPSDCPPTITDLDGDGTHELVTITHSQIRALSLHPVHAGAERDSSSLSPQSSALSPTLLWQIPLPAVDSGIPWPGLLYLRAGHFLDHPGRDLFLSSGEPHVTAALIDGRDGKVHWTRSECPDIQRYFAPTHNLVAAHDVDGDGLDELIYTIPDYYCVINPRTADFLTGPVSPQTVFSQPSQGLYTAPAYLNGPTRADDRVALTAGHYFQGVLTPDAKPAWYRLPVIGRARTSREGFLQLSDQKWLLGYGRQDGVFECIDVSTGQTRWTYDLHASASDVTTCDLDSDGHADFLFSTSDGHVYALTDDSSRPRLVWRTDCPPGSCNPVPASLTNDGHAQIILPCGDGHVRVYTAAPEP